MRRLIQRFDDNKGLIFRGLRGKCGKCQMQRCKRTGRTVFGNIRGIKYK